MATFKQYTNRNTSTSGMVGTELGFGKRDDAILSAAFVSTDDRDANKIKALCLEIFQGNTDGAAGDFVNATGDVTSPVAGADAAAYWGTIDTPAATLEINIDFKNTPDVANNVKTTNAAGVALDFGSGYGAPETPYVPPLTSPGPGKFTVGTQPGLKANAAAQLARLKEKSYEAFGGGTITGRENPFDQTIKDQTLGDYLKGSSTPSSLS
jgi:hypothetical protein